MITTDSHFNKSGTSFRVSLYPNGEFSGGYLGLSNPVNCRNELDYKQDEKVERLPRGSHGITGKQKRKIRNSCYVLQEMYGCTKLAFLTVTFPALSLDEFRRTTDHYGGVGRIFIRFCEELGRLLGRAGGVSDYAYCIEIQESRWKKHGFPGYHLHLLFVSKNRKGNYVVTPNQIRELWGRILSNALGYAPDCKAAIDLQRLKKDPSRYLSKYMSKGSQSLSEIQSEIGQEYIPHSWVGTSKQLRDVIIATTVNSQEIVNKYRQGILVEETIWFFPITKLIDDCEIVIGFSGKMKDPRYRIPRDILIQMNQLGNI